MAARLRHRLMYPSAPAPELHTVLCRCKTGVLEVKAVDCSSSLHLPVRGWAVGVAGLLHCQATADRQGQSDDRPPALPDISMLCPELQQQWHVERNTHLGATKVSHKVASRPCGIATSAQLDSHTSGQQVWNQEQTAQSAYTVAIGWCACTTLLLPWHPMWLSTGIMARMKHHHSRWLEAP